MKKILMKKKNAKYVVSPIVQELFTRADGMQLNADAYLSRCRDYQKQAWDTFFSDNPTADREKSHTYHTDGTVTLTKAA